MVENNFLADALVVTFSKLLIIKILDEQNTSPSSYYAFNQLVHILVGYIYFPNFFIDAILLDNVVKC